MSWHAVIGSCAKSREHDQGGGGVETGGGIVEKLFHQHQQARAAGVKISVVEEEAGFDTGALLVDAEGPGDGCTISIDQSEKAAELGAGTREPREGLGIGGATNDVP